MNMRKENIIHHALKVPKNDSFSYTREAIHLKRATNAIILLSSIWFKFPLWGLQLVSESLTNLSKE